MLNSRAYTQAYYIIELLSEEKKAKIPKHIMKNIESRMDKTYEFLVDENNIEEIELLEDTEKIISVIYTDYLAKEEERKIILEAERKIGSANSKQIKVNEMFLKEKQENEKVKDKSDTEKIFSNILSSIKKMFRIRIVE